MLNIFFLAIHCSFDNSVTVNKSCRNAIVRHRMRFDRMHQGNINFRKKMKAQ